MNTVSLARVATVVFAAVTVLHLLVLAGVVPYEYVGGGRYPDADTARAGEVAAALTTVLFGWVSAVHGRWAGGMSPRVNRVFMWVMGGLFGLNTLGNLAAATDQETLIFTPVTAFLAFVGFFIASRPTAKVES